MSAIGPIAAGAAAAPTAPAQDPTATEASGATGSGGGFGKALANALESLNDDLNAASEQAQALATGQTSDLTGVVMRTEQAAIELEVASQIRNKAVEAYQEIFRMQV